MTPEELEKFLATLDKIEAFFRKSVARIKGMFRRGSDQ